MSTSDATLPAPPRCEVCGAPLSAAAGSRHCSRCTSVPPGSEATLRADPRIPPDVAETARPSSQLAETRPAPARGAPAAPEGRESEPGRPFGRYRLLKRLGAGGMGVVWQARDTQLDRIVALKLIREEEVGNSTLLKRFMLEARLAAKLRHPGIVSIYDVGEIDGRAYLTMDYVEGRTLADRLKETRERLRAGGDEEAVRLRADVELLAEMAAAVAHAHESGVVHRDLKPGNVLLEDRPASSEPGTAGVSAGRIRGYVTDFGLAKDVSLREGEPGGGLGALTTSGEALGTPLYMSPEQANGRVREIGPATDVWSLGVMLYEILTGVTPFQDAGSPWAVIGAVIEKEPSSPSTRNPRVPAALEGVCLRALRKSPAERYPDAREFERELRRWLAGEPVTTPLPAPQPMPPAAPQRPGGRSRGARIGVAAGIVLALAGIAGWRAFEGTRQVQALRDLRRTAAECLQSILSGSETGHEAAGRVRSRLADAATRARAALSEPSPEPDYFEGRLARLLQEPAKAEEYQDRALAIAPDFAPALYERILLAASEYGRGYDSTRDWGDAAEIRDIRTTVALAGADPLDDIERMRPTLARHRALADHLLTRLRAARAAVLAAQDPDEGAPRVSDAALTALEATVALIQPGGSWDEAHLALLDACAREPGLDDARETLYREAISRGQARLMIDTADVGIQVHPGNAQHWRYRGVAHQMLGNGLQSQGKDSSERYRTALSDLDEALLRHPHSADPWLDRAQVRANWVIGHHARLPDAPEMFAKAAADCTEAEKRDPRHLRVLSLRGQIRLKWGQYLSAVSRDPREVLEGAAADFAALAERTPDRPEHWLSRAACAQLRASWARGPADDPGPVYQDGIADVDRALAARPKYGAAYARRAQLQSAWGDWLRRRNRDAAATLEAAVADATQGTTLDAGQPERWVELGRACWFRGLEHARCGEDPMPAYERAVGALQEAIRRGPRLPDAHHLLGEVRRHHGERVAQTGGDPAESYRNAIEHYGKALELLPNYAAPLACRGRARMLLAGLTGTSAVERQALLDGARVDLGEAFRRAPLDPDIRSWKDELEAQGK